MLGQVLDNLSGVTLLEVQIDGGDFAPVPFDASGNFAVPTAFALDGSADGAHTLRFPGHRLRRQRLRADDVPVHARHPGADDCADVAAS